MKYVKEDKYSQEETTSQGFLSVFIIIYFKEKLGTTRPVLMYMGEKLCSSKK